MLSKFTYLTLATAMAAVFLVTPSLSRSEPEVPADAASEEESVNMSGLEKNLEAIFDRQAQIVEGQAKRADDVMNDFDRSMKDLDAQMREFDRQMEDLDAQLEILDEKMSEFELPDLPQLPDLPELPAFPGVGCTSSGFDGVTISARFEESFDVGEGTVLKVDSEFCWIEVLPGEDPGRIVVQGEKTGGGETEEVARAILEKLTWTRRIVNGTLEIAFRCNQSGETEENTMRRWKVEVRVPQHTPVRIRNEYGEVRIEAIEADIDCETKFGPATVEGSTGVLNLKGEYGAIEVLRHNGTGAVESSFGDVEIDGWSGNLNLAVAYGKAKVAEVPRNASIVGGIEFGRMTIVLPEDYSGRIEASSSFGKVVAPESLERMKGMFEESARGTAGEGEGLVRVKGSYSPVVIRME